MLPKQKLGLHYQVNFLDEQLRESMIPPEHPTVKKSQVMSNRPTPGRGGGGGRFKPLSLTSSMPPPIREGERNTLTGLNSWPSRMRHRAAARCGLWKCCLAMGRSENRGRGNRAGVPPHIKPSMSKTACMFHTR